MATLTKEMIDIVNLLKRRIKTEFETQLRLADPDLLDNLIAFYQKSGDRLTRELIREVMSLAGPEWLTKIDAPPKPQVNKLERTYRGQKISVNPVAAGATKTPGETTTGAGTDSPETPKKRVRYYRGQKIVE